MNVERRLTCSYSSLAGVEEGTVSAMLNDAYSFFAAARAMYRSLGFRECGRGRNEFGATVSYELTASDEGGIAAWQRSHSD
ncbi:MAG: hypothetical protein ACOCYX_05975 [Spirochaetota bacterium]